MKTLYVLLVFGMLFAGCEKKKQLETATIKASSMVCGSCAKTIEKAVYKVDGVKEVDVDIKSKIVQVKLVPGQTNVETVEMAISDAGYDANNRKRDAAAYDKLDACCKIDG